MKNRSQILTAIFTAAYMSMAGNAALADDTEIFFTPRDNQIKPNIMFILDASGSMGTNDVGPDNEDRLDVMKRSMKSVIDGLDDVNAGFMIFGGNEGAYFEAPVADVEGEKQTLKDKIDRIATGLRLTHRVGSGGELVLTVVRAPSQNPYYTINPEVVKRILSGESISNAIVNSKEATFAVKYPTQLFLGLDGVSELFGNIYRAEIGWQSNRPATEKEGFIYSPQSALLWNFSTERYLNQGVNTLNVMLSGSKFLADKELLDFESTYFLGARYQWPFDRDRWLFEIESQIGLHAQHVNVKPRFSYQGIERQSFDFALNVFSGEEQTSANYYEDNLSVQLSWRYDL
jgi:type IV pilus assembly protein PilY1